MCVDLRMPDHYKYHLLDASDELQTKERWLVPNKERTYIGGRRVCNEEKLEGCVSLRSPIYRKSFDKQMQETWLTVSTFQIFLPVLFHTIWADSFFAAIWTELTTVRNTTFHVCPPVWGCVACFADCHIRNFFSPLCCHIVGNNSLSGLYGMRKILIQYFQVS